MISYSALVQPLALPTKERLDRRASARHLCNLEALSRPLEAPETICWGATVNDLSSGGIGLNLCYPFKRGTYLAIDLKGPGEEAHTLLGRVVHVQEQASDGTWLVGCEFVKPLSDSDVDFLVEK